MNKENVKKIADLVNLNIKEGDISYAADNPLYTPLYLEIFFDELKNGGPTAYIDFREDLLNHIDIDEPNAEAAVEALMTIWNAWTALYKGMKERSMLKHG